VPPGEWHAYGRTGHGQRYVPLDQITPDNVSLDAVAQAIGRERWQPPAAKSGRLRCGIVLRYSQEHSGRADSDGTVWFDREGRVHVPTGIGNTGSGPQTGIGIIVAVVLGLPMDRVVVTWADTADVAWDFATDASRSTHCNAKAFYTAALDLARQLKDVAAACFGIADDSLEQRDGMVAGGGRSVDSRELLGELSSRPARSNFKPFYDPALAEAAMRVATPQIRNAGTIGGNLLQDGRCPYYRGPWHCYRAGGIVCDAHHGINAEHAIFGGDRCYIVSPADLATALTALDATIVD